MEQDNPKIEGIVSLLRDVVSDYNTLSSRVDALEKSIHDNKMKEKSIVMAIDHNGYSSEKILNDAENIYANMT
jgi:hypothetical protein